jgi:transcriptional regulator with XRE-family HTH domain
MTEDPLVLFGRRLAELRVRHGWSQERLAHESGLARSYLGGVERGKRNLSLLNIYKLARTLDVEPYELLLPSTVDEDVDRLLGRIS